MKYCKEITNEIAQLLEEGSNRTDACIIAGIHYDTFMEWLRGKPEFSEAIKRAEALCKQRNINIIQKATRKYWTAAAWWLERKHQDEFSIKQKVEHAGPNGQPLTIQIAFMLDFLNTKKPLPNATNPAIELQPEGN